MQIDPIGEFTSVSQAKGCKTLVLDLCEREKSSLKLHGGNERIADVLAALNLALDWWWRKRRKEIKIKGAKVVGW